MSLKNYTLLGAACFIVLALFGMFFVNFFTALIMLVISGLLALFFFSYSKEMENKLAKFVSFVGFAAALIMALAMIIRILAVLFISPALHVAANSVSLTANIVFAVTFIIVAVRLFSGNRSDPVLLVTPVLIVLLAVIAMFIVGVAGNILFYISMLLFGLLLGYMFFKNVTL